MMTKKKKKKERYTYITRAADNHCKLDERSFAHY